MWLLCEIVIVIWLLLSCEMQLSFGCKYVVVMWLTCYLVAVVM